jgi:hypothetical protein
MPPSIVQSHTGIGKTLSARRYSHWNQALPLLDTWGPRDDCDFAVYADLAKNRTDFYTPEVLTTPRQLRDALLDITTRVDICIGEHHQHINPALRPHPNLDGTSN